MSSTAAQRSVADYKAAGLNPALAYDKTASSPGGAQATIGNELGGVSEGVATAQRAREVSAQLKAIQANTELTNVQRSKTAVEAATAITQQKIAEEQNNQAMLETKKKEMELSYLPKFLPQQLQAQTLANLINGLSLPGLQNEAQLQKKLGITGAAIPFILNSAKGVKGLIK